MSENTMPDYVQRIMDEQKQLGERIDKLAAFIKTEKFIFLNSRQRTLMSEQLEVMKDYHEILACRLANL
jgi:hypothetical protein